jgi:hypothetical protein
MGCPKMTQSKQTESMPPCHIMVFLRRFNEQAQIDARGGSSFLHDFRGRMLKSWLLFRVGVSKERFYFSILNQGLDLRRLMESKLASPLPGAMFSPLNVLSLRWKPGLSEVAS